MPKISQYTAVTTPSDSDELVVVQAGVTKKMTLTKLADYVDVGSKPFTTATDPALNTAATTAIVNAYSGTIITTTKAGNSQTLAAPTVVTAGKYFTVVNNDTSTHSIPFVANGITFTITAGESQSFIWYGSAWGPTDLGITDIPVKVVQGGTGASTLTDHGILLGSGTDPITALGAMTNGQLVIGSTGLDPVVASITDGEGIDTTAGAGTLTIACEDASTSNKGVTVYSGSTKALAGTDTASAMTPADVAAKVAVDVNLRAMSQGVAMTAAGSGSSGIAVGDNDNLNMGTGNFAPYFCGIIPDVTPTTDIILAQKHDATNGWILTLLTTGYLRTTINAATYDSTATLASIGVVDGENVNILSGITRETDSVAGSVQPYVNGRALGTSVAITAGAPTTVTNAVSLYVLGTSAVRTAGVANTFALFNHCPTAAEVLDLYRNGIAEANKWGSQTPIYTSDFSAGVDSWNAETNVTHTGNVDGISDGTTTKDNVLQVTANATNGTHVERKSITLEVGKQYLFRFTYYIPSGQSNVDGFFFRNASATIQSFTSASATPAVVGTWATASVLFTSTATIVTLRFYLTDGESQIFSDAGADDLFYIAEFTYKQLGAIIALESEGIQPAPGQWLDSSTNNLHALQPATGSSLTRSKRDFTIKWTNTWAGTHEVQYIGGLDQAILPPNCYIDSIIGVITGGTIEDIIIGDGSDTDRWVTITTGLAAGTVAFTIANAISDGTNYKMTVDPDANFTGSIAWTINGKIL